MLCSRAQQQYNPYNITIKALTIFFSHQEARILMNLISSFGRLACMLAFAWHCRLKEWNSNKIFLHLMKKNAKLGCCGRMLGKYLPAELKRYMSVFWPDLFPSFNESLVPFQKKKKSWQIKAQIIVKTNNHVYY